MAATDASDLRYPTLAQALALVPDDGEVLLLHNFAQARETATSGSSLEVTPAVLRRLRDARADELHRLAAKSSERAQFVLTTNSEPAVAVLEQAGRRDADLVILGAHMDGPAARARHRTAIHLIERLQRSVLVVPLN